MATITREQALQINDDFAPVATLGNIPGGVAGVRRTLDIMIAIVKQYRKNSEIRSLAESIIADVPQKDTVGEIRAIFEWVRDNVRYTEDVRDVETLKTPDVILKTRQGDCDDKSTLLAALIESIGKKTRFIACGVNSPGLFEHVFVQVLLGTRWISMDATENVALGWTPPGICAYMERHV